LDCCSKLEELSLNNNCIWQIEGTTHWPLLQRLSLADNLIGSVSDCGLDIPTRLQYLSLENNRITSLAGFQQISLLAELYLSGNLVSNARSIFPLKVKCCVWYIHNTTITYLDLGPAVPAGTLGNELFSSSTVTGNAPGYLMGSTATDTHFLHCFYKRIPPCPLWHARSSISSL